MRGLAGRPYFILFFSRLGTADLTRYRKGKGQGVCCTLHARVEQKRLRCNIFKTLFRSARLGRMQGVAAARSAEMTATSDVAGT